MALARVMCIGEGNRAILKPEGLLTRDQEWLNVKNSVRRKARKRFNSRNVNIQYLSESIFRLLLQLKLNLKTKLLIFLTKRELV
jgi:hypothetical protein